MQPENTNPLNIRWPNDACGSRNLIMLTGPTNATHVLRNCAEAQADGRQGFRLMNALFGACLSARDDRLAALLLEY